MPGVYIDCNYVHKDIMTVHFDEIQHIQCSFLQTKYRSYWGTVRVSDHIVHVLDLTKCMFLHNLAFLCYEDDILEPMFFYKVCFCFNYLQFEPI